MIDGLQAFYHGMLLGLIFIVSFGPIFFAIIETSINRGFWPASAIALGAMLSDAAYISVSFLGVAAFFETSQIKFVIGLAGGIILIVIGLVTFLKKPTLKHDPLLVKSTFGIYGYAAKGFLVNTLNPFVFIFWFSTMGIVSVEYQDSRADRIVFFAGTLMVIFSSDVLKAFIANKIKLLLTPTLMRWFNRIAGSVMIYFGIELMWKVFRGKPF